MCFAFNILPFMLGAQGQVVNSTPLVGVVSSLLCAVPMDVLIHPYQCACVCVAPLV